MANENTGGTMISRPLPAVPTSPQEMVKFLTKVLNDHQKDIATLFAQCTDADLFEKRQRDNAGS